MPKTTIRATDENQPFRPAVGWDRDQTVQLGLQVWDSDQHIVDVLYRDGYEADLGKQARVRIEALLHQSGALGRLDDAQLGEAVLTAMRDSRSVIERDGIWCDLGRRAINDLIRALRKARDSALGSDA